MRLMFEQTWRGQFKEGLRIDFGEAFRFPVAWLFTAVRRTESLSRACSSRLRSLVECRKAVAMCLCFQVAT